MNKKAVPRAGNYVDNASEAGDAGRVQAVAITIAARAGPKSRDFHSASFILAMVTGTISTSPAPFPGYVVTEYIFVGGQVTVLDAATLKAVKADVTDLEGPRSVAFSPDSKYLYVADKFKGVAVFER